MPTLSGEPGAPSARKTDEDLRVRRVRLEREPQAEREAGRAERAPGARGPFSANRARSYTNSGVPCSRARRLGVAAGDAQPAVGVDVQARPDPPRRGDAPRSSAGRRHAPVWTTPSRPTQRVRARPRRRRRAPRRGAATRGRSRRWPPRTPRGSWRSARDSRSACGRTGGRRPPVRRSSPLHPGDGGS